MLGIIEISPVYRKKERRRDRRDISRSASSLKILKTSKSYFCRRLSKYGNEKLYIKRGISSAGSVAKKQRKQFSYLLNTAQHIEFLAVQALKLSFSGPRRKKHS